MSTIPEQKQKLVELFDLISDKCGPDSAKTWLWEGTPYPAGLPSEEQIQEGLALASGSTTLEELRKKWYDSISKALEQYNASEAKSER